MQEAQAYAEENSLLFMETSAKTAMNVNDIFLAIGRWILILIGYYEPHHLGHIVYPVSILLYVRAELCVTLAMKYNITIINYDFP